MDKAIIEKVKSLVPTTPIRTGELVSLAQQAGIDEPELWAAMTQLERDDIVVSRTFPHPKKKSIKVVMWVRKQVETVGV